MSDDLLMHSVTCGMPTSLYSPLRNDSAKCHILGSGDPWMGPMAPKFKLGRDFCTMHLAAKFHHPTFNHSKAIMLTSKQTKQMAL